MPQAHLTSMKIEHKDGFEFATFGLSAGAVVAISKKVESYNEIADGKDILKEMFAGYYTGPRRPSAREIAHVDIKPIPNNPVLVDVTLKIRRGHWELAKFIKEHAGHWDKTAEEFCTFSTDVMPDVIRLDCPVCNKNLQLDPESLP